MLRIAGCVLSLLTVGCGAAQDLSMSIASPAAYQVFQRDGANQGKVLVKGCLSVDATKVEARVVQASDGGTVVKDWRPVALDAGAKTFEGALSVPAGGWYRLDVRASKADGSEVASASVGKVGIGDIFICAGQSNAANSGTVRMKAQDDRVAAYGRRVWSHCDDPLAGASGGGGSPWPVLGDLLVTNLGVPVAFASVAEGGTCVKLWTPESNPSNYRKIKFLLGTFGKNDVKAILWHQGESDTAYGTSTADYESMLTSIITQSRKDAGYDVPWLVANVSFVPGIWESQPAKCEAIRAAQQNLWKKGIALRGPDTDSLRDPIYRAPDKIHFSELGLRAHGQRWFAAVWSQVYEGR